MKLYWGPGVRVRAVRDLRVPVNFVARITSVMYEGSIVYVRLDWVPDGRAKWYALDELQAI
jgi:hypothetical protein